MARSERMRRWHSAHQSTLRFGIFGRSLCGIAASHHSQLGLERGDELLKECAEVLRLVDRLLIGVLLADDVENPAVRDLPHQLGDADSVALPAVLEAVGLHLVAERLEITDKPQAFFDLRFLKGVHNALLSLAFEGQSPPPFPAKSV